MKKIESLTQLEFKNERNKNISNNKNSPKEVATASLTMCHYKGNLLSLNNVTFCVPSKDVSIDSKKHLLRTQMDLN